MKKLLSLFLAIILCAVSFPFTGTVYANTVEGWYTLPGTEGLSAGAMAYL